MKNRKSRICVVRHGYFPTDPRVRKEVYALNDAGFSVDVICLRLPGEKIKEKINGVKVYRLPYQHMRGSQMGYLFRYSLSFLLMMLLLTVLYLKRFYDCIQINTLPDALVFIAFVPKLFGSKVLLDMHEPTPELWLSVYGENRMKWILKLHILIEQQALKYADRVITVNENLRQRFIERGANGNKIKVIRNVPQEVKHAQSVGQFPQNSFIILYHGAIEKRYGLEIALHALPILRQKIDHFHFHIIGDGEQKKELCNLVATLHCSDLVTFSGFKPFPELVNLIFQADIGIVPILPTPFGELCQPNKLFDYVALKKPVVISRLKAVEEIFDNSCVMYFQPGNPEDLARSVYELHIHPEMRKTLVENAYCHYKKMRWGESKKKYVKIVENLVGSSDS